MSKMRAHSSPDLLPLAWVDHDANLDGVATNVKLLLKLVQEHNEACNKSSDDDRRPQRVAGMLSILSDVTSKIERWQVSSQKAKREAELRRCNTDLRRNPIPREKKPQELQQEENERLRKDLCACTVAKKNLERMFTSLGKEKEIIAAELARKVQELSGMEEHLSDLKNQNEMLLAKVQSCTASHKEKKVGGRDNQANAALQERNKVLSEQLLKSIDGYRALKRKFKEAQEENSAIRAMMAQVAGEVAAGLHRIHDMRHRMGGNSDMPMDNVEEELAAVDAMFRCFEAKLMINGPKRGECLQPIGDVPAATEKPPVLV